MNWKIVSLVVLLLLGWLLMIKKPRYNYIESSIPTSIITAVIAPDPSDNSYILYDGDNRKVDSLSNDKSRLLEKLGESVPLNSGAVITTDLTGEFFTLLINGNSYPGWWKNSQIFFQTLDQSLSSTDDQKFVYRLSNNG